MKKNVSVLLIATLIMLSGCEKFEFDPNQSVDLVSEENLNFNQVNILKQTKEDSIITIALIGDTHIDYKNTDEIIERINSIPEVDFVVHAGDLTEHGILQEFKWTANYLDKIHKPFVTVIGNHDIVGRGEHIYKHMFGPTNYSFIYAGVKFILFNSNSREYEFSGNVPDISWINQTINNVNKTNRTVLISHVPYFDKDFDQTLRQEYLNIFRDSSVILSLNGHLHDGFDIVSEEHSVLHLGAGSTNREGYMIISIKGKEITYEKRFL
jgi:Icc protein